MDIELFKRDNYYEDVCINYFPLCCAKYWTKTNLRREHSWNSQFSQGHDYCGMEGVASAAHADDHLSYSVRIQRA